MVIATKNINVEEVIKRSDDYEYLCEYFRSLVPSKLKHVDAIYHNTRYYACCLIQSDDDIRLDVKKKVANLLMRDIRVVGYLDDYITVQELERMVNMERVNKYYKGDKYGKSC